MKKHAILVLAAVALVLMTGIALKEVLFASGPQSCVSSGLCVGPATIRSYFATANNSNTVAIVPSVEGMNGMIITDVMYSTDDNLPSFQLRSSSSSGAVVLANFGRLPNTNDAVHQHEVHFRSGIPVPAGHEVQVRALSSATVAVTISGYVY